MAVCKRNSGGGIFATTNLYLKDKFADFIGLKFQNNFRELF
jgi:hypothetical protein